jgi:hypothetical protein
MRLRFSIVGSIVAGAYAAGALFIASREASGSGCMGWCLGLATFPEFFLLAMLPTGFFYSEAWNHFWLWIFAFGSIGLNAFILYVIFGGVAWWRGL